MMRTLFSGRVILLVLAIAFVVALLGTKRQGPPVDDPVADAQEELKDGFGLSVDRQLSAPGGLRVLDVVPGKGAQMLGMKRDDRILAVNELSIWHAKQLLDYLSDAMDRGPVRLMVRRGDEYRVVLIGAPRGPGGQGGPGSPGAMRGRMPGPGGPAPGGGRGRAPAPPPGPGGGPH